MARRFPFFRRFRRPDISRPPPVPSGLSSEEMLATRILERHRRRTIRRAQRYRSFLIRTNQRMVGVSLVLLVIAGLVFGIFVYWRLYQVQDYSAFSHNITRVVPLPLGRVGSSFIPYKDYLADLRRQVHYFETQQQLDFSQPEEDDLVSLAELKNFSLQRIIDRIYIRKLADRHGLSVSQAEVDRELSLLQAQNKLGGDLDDIQGVLAGFWGLELDDYRQLVVDQLLRDKVVAYMDVSLGNDAHQRAEEVLRQLKAGSDFSEMAGIYSEDVASSLRGGEYDVLLDLEEQDEHPRVLKAAFETPAAGFSEIIDTGRRLVIVKVLADEGGGLRRAAHISISYLALSDVLAEIREEEPVELYVEGVEYTPILLRRDGSL